MKGGGEGGRARREGPWARGPCRDHSVPTRRAGRFRSRSSCPPSGTTTRRCSRSPAERGRLPRGIGVPVLGNEETPPGPYPRPPPSSSSSFSARDASRDPRRQDAAGRDSGSAPVKGAARVPFFFRGGPTSPRPEQLLLLLVLILLLLLLLLLLHHHYPDAEVFAKSLREESLAITPRSSAVLDRQSLTL